MIYLGTVTASMGPQPFGCGRAAGPCREAAARRCFNGAATFRLRKEPASWLCCYQRSCFNGAATFRLRKAAGVRSGPPQNSMLQWGRNLSVAEGSRSLKSTVISSLLQWGRNLSVAEGGSKHSTSGPPPTASMGPQPFGCGRPSCEKVLANRLRLQWGRNLSVAEGRVSLLTGRLDLTSFNGAATFRLRKARRAASTTARSAGFNGAATFRLRKDATPGRLLICFIASMGPQPFGCGRAAAQCISARRVRASMGPQPFGCGRFAMSAGAPPPPPIASMGPQPFGCGRDVHWSLH